MFFFVVCLFVFFYRVPNRCESRLAGADECRHGFLSFCLSLHSLRLHHQTCSLAAAARCTVGIPHLGPLVSWLEPSPREWDANTQSHSQVRTHLLSRWFAVSLPHQGLLPRATIPVVGAATQQGPEVDCRCCKQNRGIYVQVFSCQAFDKNKY